jgi:hypothetical protein
MTRRTPGFARAFAGRWRITEMDEWDEIDLLGSAHMTFSGKYGGELCSAPSKPISMCATRG